MDLHICNLTRHDKNSIPPTLIIARPNYHVSKREKEKLRLKSKYIDHMETLKSLLKDKTRFLNNDNFIE